MMPRAERRPSWRAVVIWCVTGAGLFLGVGAALPVWTVYPSYSPVGPDGICDVIGPTKGPLWEAASSMPWTASLTNDTVDFILALALSGVGAGLYAHLGYLWLRRRKGGEA
jgi:hypothetical protein